MFIIICGEICPIGVISDSESITNGYFPFHPTGPSTIMNVMNSNIGKDLVAFAQSVVAPVADMPLEGINFLLDAIGFQNPVEHLHLIKAGLVDYEDFCYLIKKDIQDMVEEFSKQTVAQGRITFGLGHQGSCIGSKIVSVLTMILIVSPLMKKHLLRLRVMHSSINLTLT